MSVITSCMSDMLPPLQFLSVAAPPWSILRDRGPVFGEDRIWSSLGDSSLGNIQAPVSAGKYGTGMDCFATMRKISLFFLIVAISLLQLLTLGVVLVGFGGQRDVCPHELEASLHIPPHSDGVDASVTATL
jgi:hypothetical protein